MQLEAIYHSNDIPYVFAVDRNAVKIRIRVKKNDIVRCVLMCSDRYHSPGKELPIELTPCAATQLFDYYEGLVTVPTKRLRYQFLLTDKAGKEIWYGERALSASRVGAGYFQFPYICDADLHVLPSWLADAVVYQIFPDRFRKGECVDSSAPDTRELNDWSDDNPNELSMYGGNLQGIIEKLPYLVDLGVNTIYMTPIFASHSNHKYDTIDYYKIDPVFGSNETLKQLVDLAHACGIRVLLDAVFNHTGDDFYAFQQAQELGEESAYRNWYHFNESPELNEYNNTGYETFGINVSTMPKLRTANPDVSAYFIDVALYWLKEVGIDGWRLDVANEVDHQFWRALRQAVKPLYPEAALIGEIMHYSGAWLRGDQFDGVMNYWLRDVMLDFFAAKSISASTFAGQLDEILMSYTDQANTAMMQLLGSHDTERFLTACSRGGWGWQSGESTMDRMKLAVGFQMTYVGMPMIYYGDEVGMSGKTDPECRKPMVWQEDKQNKPLLAHYKKLIRLRHQYAPLRCGTTRVWFVDEIHNTVGFLRSHGDVTIGIVLNNSPTSWTASLSLPEQWQGSTLRDLLTDKQYPESPSLSIPLQAYGMVILSNQL